MTVTPSEITRLYCAAVKASDQQGKQLGNPKGCHILQASEFPRMVRDIAAINPAIGLEIGMGGGGSHALFCRIVSTLFVTVEARHGLSFGLEGALGGGEWNGWPTDWTFTERSLLLLGYPSTAQETLKHVAKVLAGRKLDFLYIDGDHGDPQPALDMEAYAPMVRVGGLIGLHDTVRIPGPMALIAAIKAGEYPGIEHVWTEYNQSLVRKGVVA